MKVLLLGPELRNRDGGPAGIVDRVYNYSKKCKCKVNIKLMTIVKGKKIVSFCQIVKEILFIDYDVINVHSGNMLSYLLAFFPLFYRKKIVLTQHGYPRLEENMPVLRRILHVTLMDLTLKRFNYISFVSKFFKNIYLKNENISCRSFVTPNGLDDSLNKSKIIKKNINKIDEIIIIGDTKKYKGLHAFIKVLSQSKIKVPIKFFGRKGICHNEFSYYLNIYNKRGGKAKYMGPISHQEVMRVLSESYFVVVPSLFDTFNMVVLEAMYYKNIVFCSSSVGASQLIKNGYNGYTYNSNDELLTLIINREKLISKNIGENAHETAKDNLWENNINYYIEMYKTIRGELYD